MMVLVTGSLPGAIIAPLIFTVLPEILCAAGGCRRLFYVGAIAWASVCAMRPRKRFAAVLGGAIAGGVVPRLWVRLLAPVSWGQWLGFPEAGSLLNQVVQGRAGDSGKPPAGGQWWWRWWCSPCCSLS
ncbi:MAG: hypothetical protein H6651_07340 [Ardenticatenales bacterium]|nr:hypothetical protein [Ardenticatenales bacterium]